MTRTHLAAALLGAVLALVACSGEGADEAGPVATTAAAPTTSAPVTTDVPIVTSSSTTAPPTTLSTAPTPTSAPVTAAPARAYDFSDVAPVVEAFVAERGLNGAGLVIVQADDGVVYEEYWGEFDADRISFIASSSKMVTAGVLLRLADDGLLDIDAPIADVVEWGAGNPEITVAQLLSNSSGLVGLLPNPAYRPYVCQFLLPGTVEDCAAQVFATSDDDADIVAPDTEYRYGGVQWQVAGGVAEAVSGKPWEQLIDEIYVQPCGLETLGYNNHFTQLGISGFEYPADFDGDLSKLAATDNPNMEGGAYATPRDYAELLLMHLRGGRCGDEQVLSQRALDRMHADRIGEVYDGSTQTGSGYGMGWWVDRNTGRISDPGAYGSIPWLDLDGGYGGYFVIEADTATGMALVAQIEDLVDNAVTTAVAADG